jgi:hypothetical protein
MENQEMTEQKILSLESEIYNANENIKALTLVNFKLGYSIRLMSEFHISQSEKIKIANSFDDAKNVDEIKAVYEKYKNDFINNSLDEDSSDFQWSKEFQNNLRHYFSVSIGYDIISEIANNLSVIAKYFALENKIRRTPDSALRNPMTEKLLKDREETLIAMDNIINMINSFNKES